MRKLLLASAAILGATGGLALAQEANPNQGQLISKYGAGPAANNNNNSWGIANTPSGSAAAGGLSGSIYSPNVDKTPDPGTIVIRLNGRVEADVTGNWETGDSHNGYKVNPIGVGSFMRLYPGFDGKAANGLRYGAAVELRENFGTGTSSYTNLAGGTSAPSASGFSSTQTVFVRRAFTYIASDQLGLVRIGQDDGVIGLFDNCIFTSGCWDGGDGNFGGGTLQSVGNQSASIPFAWLSGQGAEYANNKIVYLSPQLYGFDVGLQYAPSMGNAYAQNCNGASVTCEALTAGNDPTRWFNQVGAGVRFQHPFGPVDFKAYGFYETAGKESQDVGAVATTVGHGYAIKYDNLNFVNAGVAVTAAGTTFAVDYIGGAINSQLAMRPTGGAPTSALLYGVTYKNGPLTVGAEAGFIDTQGSAALTKISQRHEYEFAAGGSYGVAPGLTLVLEYMYQHRHQGDYNFLTGATGSTGDVQSNGILFTTMLNW